MQNIETTLAKIERKHRAIRGWITRRKNERADRLERWRAVKPRLASERDY